VGSKRPRCLHVLHYNGKEKKIQFKNIGYYPLDIKLITDSNGYKVLWRSCFLPSGIAKNSLEEIGIKKPLWAHSLKNHAKKPTKKRDLNSKQSLSYNKAPKYIYYNLSIQVLCLT